MRKAIPELGLDTQTIERLLQALQIDESIPYAALSDAIGRDVRTEARHALDSARRRLLRAHRLLFECVRGVGLKRLGDEGKVSTGEWHLRRARTQAKKCVDKVTAVDNFQALPNDLKVQHNVLLAQAGVLRHITSPKTTAKLQKAVDQPKRDLALRECLEAMKPAL